jgi:DNA-binding LytR/AlgR family response regulator
VVAQCETGTEALEAIRRLKPDIALLDMQMPGLDGLGVVTALEAWERPAVIFVTAHERFAVEAFGVRAADYVLKPFDRQRLAVAIGRAAEFAQARRERAGGPAAP